MTDFNRDTAVKIADNIIILQAEIAEREEAIKNYKAKLAEWFEPGEYVLDDRKVTVYYHKAINEAYAKANEPELYEKALVTKEVFNAAGAKKNLSEEEYARVQKVSTEPSVKIELLDD